MVFLNRRAFFYGVAGSVMLPGIARAAGEPLKSALDSVSKRYVDSGALPMVVTGLTDANGTLYEGAFGRKSAAGPEPVALDSVFYYASMSKPLTGVAAMQLVEKGKLKLDDPVKNMIADADKLQVLDGFDSAGKPILRKPKRELTLRHLLTHSSGFGHVIWDENVKRYAGLVGGLKASVESDPQSWLHPLVFDPGTKWEYSSVGMDWVHRLVAEASGKSFGSYMRENVLGPLQMTSTEYVISPDMLRRTVDNHQRQEDGSFTAIPFAGQKPPVREYGAGETSWNGQNS